jgi:hypothetical protein
MDHGMPGNGLQAEGHVKLVPYVTSVYAYFMVLKRKLIRTQIQLHCISRLRWVQSLSKCSACFNFEEARENLHSVYQWSHEKKPGRRGKTPRNIGARIWFTDRPTIRFTG